MIELKLELAEVNNLAALEKKGESSWQ